MSAPRCAVCDGPTREEDEYIVCVRSDGLERDCPGGRCGELPILFTGSQVRATLDGSMTATRRVVKGVDRANQMILKRPTKTRVGTSTHVLDAPKHGLCPYGTPGDLLWVRETWQAVHISTPGMDGDWDCYEADEIPKDNEAGWWSVIYAATDPTAGDHIDDRLPFRPSIHMPKWAARLWLRVTDVRVERVQDITNEQAIAEGIRAVTKDGSLYKFCVYDRGDMSSVPWADMPCSAIAAFHSLWDSINASPRPVKVAGEIVSYEAFPFDESHPINLETTHRGLPLRVYPNPWNWVVEFEMVER